MPLLCLGTLLKLGGGQLVQQLKLLINALRELHRVNVVLRGGVKAMWIGAVMLRYIIPNLEK